MNLSITEIKSKALELGIELKPEVSLHALEEQVHKAQLPKPSSFSQKRKTQTKKRRKPKRNHNASAKVDDADNSNQDLNDVDNIDYITPTLTVEDEAFKDFIHVFEKFIPQAIEAEEEHEEEVIVVDAEADEDSDMDMDQDDTDSDTVRVSKKKLRKLNQMKVYELKAISKRPDLVEWVDATASDPKFLVSLKALRNVVPVPRHWSQKKKYLQNKRGVLKKPFELPSYIRATGIMEIRDTTNPDDSKLKNKTRQRMQPKMGRIDIDYQKLHDAFFKYQTKPQLSIQGDIYYEGKEFEANFHAKRPGELSEELKSALNMPPNAPAPWLINMQRYGPPPSYPNLKIPGLNAPIPPGAQWGYHPGGWGKPPVDEYNRPLYGDVFGVYIKPTVSTYAQKEKVLWGQLEPEEESISDDEQEEQEEDEDMEMDEENESTPDGYSSTVSGLETPSLPLLMSGVDTPDHIQLRKEKSSKFSNEPPKELYTVIKQKEANIGGFMGSQHVYDLTGLTPNSSQSSSVRKGDIEVAFNPDELQDGMSQEMLKKRYEQQVEAKNSSFRKENLSDMVIEHSSKQAAKKKEKSDKKKDKEYKF